VIAMPKDQLPIPAERAEALLEGRRRLARAFVGGAPAIYEAHTSLLRANERPVGAFRLQSGWVLRERLLSEDGRAVLAVYLPGDVVGLEGLFSARATDDIVALTSAVCHVLPLAELTRLMERDPLLALRVAHLLDRERRRAERLAIGLGRCDAETRLAAFLLDLHDRLRAHGLVTSRSFRVPMTQQQIGHHLGLTVVHVNRVLRRLREQGVALMRRSVVVIADFDRLCGIARQNTARPQDASEEPAPTGFVNQRLPFSDGRA
jgi:CRP-like cAMP-binding protein